MMVEEISNGKLGDENNTFPVGLRVLAVDDDMASLKLLELLLKKCQYQVTTCDQGKVALEMLRENRKRFDIIIANDHMPDMDGFKLLEHVGLGMHLPIITKSDPMMVMKGIAHGACDYLVKPVRIEELKNIWQHVVRKKTREPNQKQNIESGIRINSNRKNEEEEEEESQKPRVVWSIDLHSKFVAAVNQLGIKNAVPKRILEHMNVEGLTRENVASHLQKYRIYLRRMSLVTPSSSVISAEGEEPYMRMNSFNVFSNTTVQENTINSEVKSNDLYKGIRVLIVDSDLNELILLDNLLQKWQCHVTIATKAKEALEISRENKNSFDFLITEVCTPDMSGFKFLELVGIETDLPIIMLLGNTDGDIITNGNTYGACYYLVKPIRSEDLRMMWQYVMRRKAQLLKLSGPKRKPRLVWTMDLHSKFIAAVNQVGIEKATPKKILEHMDVEGLTRENVAAHLQKYRLQLRGEKETEYFRPNIDDSGTQKKPRIIWTVDIHKKFVTAINELGDKNVVPERILELMNVEWLTREDVASHLEKYNLQLHWIGANANTFNSVSTLEKVGCVVAQEREKASLFQPETINNISTNLVVCNAVTIPISQTSCQDNEWVLQMMDLSLIDEENNSKCSNLQRNGVENSAIDSKMRSDEDYLLEKMESQNECESTDDFTDSMIKRWDVIAKLALLADSYLQSRHGAKDKVYSRYNLMEKMIEATSSNRAYFLLGVTFTIFVFMILKMF